VAYGVGGPVLVVSNQAVLTAMSASGTSHRIALMFLGGVGLQVLLSILNKYVAWGNYYAALNGDAIGACMRSCCEFISRQLWIDIVVDILTLVLFMSATFLVLEALTT